MADVKTMVQGSKTVGREVDPAMEMGTNVVPGDYHDYSSSASKQMENSYTASRRDPIVAALGNKDSVKG